MHLKQVALVAFVSLSLQAASRSLPPLPVGVAELKFSELLTGPVGDRGLRLSEKVKSLDGQRVRLLGHMVRQEHSVPGMFLLTPIPVQLHDEHYGLADDLPPATVFVSTPSQPKGAIQYKPGLVLVTGILSVGNREEGDGRISVFRIEMDAPRKVRAGRKGALPQVTKTGQTRLGRRSLQ